MVVGWRLLLGALSMSSLTAVTPRRYHVAFALGSHTLPSHQAGSHAEGLLLLGNTFACLELMPAVKDRSIDRLIDWDLTLFLPSAHTKVADPWRRPGAASAS